jgi:DNA invertase Pin-like site-specific DNA recombinase
VSNIRCAIYSRYSTDEQNPTSIEAQVSQCVKRIEAEKWELVETFADAGISGTATGNRPDYNRMITAAKERAFEIVVVNDLSRLARSTDLDPIIRRLRHRQVRVIGVQDHFDSDAPTAGMQASMSGMVSQHTIEMISKRTHSAQEEIVTKKGASAGGLAYGYKVIHDLHPSAVDKSGRPLIVAKRLEIEPKEAEVVKRVFNMYADEGLSTLAIAAHLNAEGVPSPGSRWARKNRRSKGWLASTLSSNPERGCGILHNELYIGRYIWNRTKGAKDPDTGAMEYRPRPKEEWIIEARPQLRIIDDERRVERARSRGAAISKGIASSRTKIGGADSRYWLGGLLRCGVCGARMIGDSGRDFICPSYASGACSNDLRVRREQVHDAVLEPLLKHLLSDTMVAKVQAQGTADLKRMAKEEGDAARKCTPSKELKRLHEEEAALRAANLRAAFLNAALAAIDEERQAITAKADASTAAKESRARALLAKVPQIVERYREMVTAGAKALADPRSVGAAREALRQLLADGTVVLTPNATHTALVGAVRFTDLGDHILGLAGFKRRCKAVEEAKGLLSMSQVVAGARYRHYLPPFHACRPGGTRGGRGLIGSGSRAHDEKQLR